MHKTLLSGSLILGTEEQILPYQMRYLCRNVRLLKPDQKLICVLIGLCLPHSSESIRQLISKVYPDLDSLHNQTEVFRIQYLKERAILAPLNIDVDDVNVECLNSMSGSGNTYFSVDVALNVAGNPDHSFPIEYLNTINMAGMPNYELTLKVGCPIILLRSLNPFDGLCNGTRMIATTLGERVIEAKIVSGTHYGQMAFIPRISLISNSSSGLPFNLRRRQFPIRVAFGMTINKSQG